MPQLWQHMKCKCSAERANSSASMLVLLRDPGGVDRPQRLSAVRAGHHPPAACLAIRAGTWSLLKQISVREAAVLYSAKQVITGAACPVHCLHNGGRRLPLPVRQEGLHTYRKV